MSMVINTPIHPIFVHYPIALFTTALGLQIMSYVLKNLKLHQSAIYVYILASAAAPLTVGTGVWEAEGLNLNHPVRYFHQNFGFAVLGFSLLNLILLRFVHKRKAHYFQAVFTACLLITAFLVVCTAYFGGELVYQYAVGVKE